jgi:hypothetical protein
MAPYLTPGFDRRIVLVVGSHDRPLEDQLKARGLSPRFIAEGALTGELKTNPRAVVFEYKMRFRETILRYLVPIWNTGAMIVVQLRQPNDPDERVRANEEIKSALSMNQRSRMTDELGIRLEEASDPAALAEACARHEPGRAAGAATIAGLDELPNKGLHDRLLLARAFQHPSHTAISVTPLTGGFTETRVYRVEVTRTDGFMCAPFVAKLGPHAEIRQEIETSRDFVADQIPFPNHPPILHDRSVIGADDRVLVSRLVDGAERFDDFMASCTAAEAVAAVRLLFDGALRFWRGASKYERVDAVAIYRDELRVIPDASRLISAATIARKTEPSLAEPGTLLSRAAAWPRVLSRLCLGHGDLHIRNIFVRRNRRGGYELFDVVLIDYALAGRTFLRSRDLATLEVSVALDQTGGNGYLTAGALARLYSPALLRTAGTNEPRTMGLRVSASAARLRNADLGLRRSVAGRYSVINALRNHAREDGIEAREYAISLFAYFLRYAKFVGKQPEERCAQAYRLASRVADVLDEEFKAASAR